MMRHQMGKVLVKTTQFIVMVFLIGAEQAEAVDDDIDNRIVITVNRTQYILVEGDAWYVPANYSSNPPATFVDWVRFSRVSIGDLGHRRSGGTLETPSLNVTNILRQDQGIYEMFVNNSRGLIYGPLVNLTVWYPPCCSLNSESRRFVTEEVFFTIPVSLSAFPNPLSVDWLVDGVPVDRSTGRFVNGNLGNPSLRVRGILRTDEGNYSMTATNEAGPIKNEACACNITIIVTYKPEMTCHTVGPITLTAGSNLQLNVTVQAKPPISFLDWQKDNQPVDRTSGRFLQGNSFHPNLTILSIQREDSGVYSVYSNNSIGSNSTCNVRVNVLFPPIMNCPIRDIVTVPEGSTVYLPVNIQANPVITFLDWLKDGLPVDRSSGRFSGGSITQPNLTIVAITPADSGQYTVFSNNSVGSQSACNITVDVQYTPRLSCLSPNNINVEEFSQVTLNISVLSSPGLSHVEWFKDNKTLDRGLGRYQNGNITTPSLTVTNVQKNDTGLYSVYVNNSIGAARGCNIYINVQYVPSVTCLSRDKLIVNKTGDFTIRVRVDSNPRQTFVVWNKDGVPVDYNSGRVENGNINDPSLTVRNAQNNDTGIYNIFVSNTVGSVTSCAVEVVVQELTCETNENITTQEGSDIQLGVKIQIQPAIGFLDWLKDNRQVDRTTGRFLGGNSTHPNLTILATIPEDSGVYVLFSNNTVGTWTSCSMGVDVQYTPRITCLPPGNISVEEFSQFTLNVSIRSNPRLSHVQWFKDDKALKNDSGRFLNGNVHIPSLTVVNVQRNDTGWYTVYVNNSVGEVRGCRFHVDIQFQPVKTCLSPENVTVPEGSDVDIPVSIAANPPITYLVWLKDDRPLNRTSGRFLGGNVAQPNLTILSIKPEDTGRYTVISNNTVGSESTCNVTIDVQYSPRIYCLPPSNISVEEFSQFSLRISVQTNPALSYVEWFKDDMELDEDTGRRLNGNVDVPSLTVLNVQRNDSGSYSVYVNNSIGATWGCLYHVDVLYEPTVTCFSNDSITVNESNTFVIPVSVDANPLQSYVNWFRNKVPVNRSSGRFENGDIVEPSLTIQRIQDVDAGRYTIFVNNSVGSVETCDVDIIVQIKPRIRTTNYTVCETALVTMDCRVVAFPAIHSLFWTKGGQPVNTTSPRYSGGTVAVPSLTINHAVQADKDLYHCVAENAAGRTTSSTIHLNVLSKPIITFERNYTLTEQATALIACSVTADPKTAAVMWYKDGVKVETTSSRYSDGDVNNPSLTINRVVKDDAGVYVCTAINDVGERESQAIYVIVRYSPTVTVKYNNYGVARGTTTVIWCEVEAFPPVTSLEWRMKDGTPLSPRPNCSDISPSYKLCSIADSDSGIYQCVATNDVRTTISTDINVFVRDQCLINVTEIKLSQGIRQGRVYNGRLEVLVDGVWGTVCGKGWSLRATEIVCGMLGFSFGVSGMYGAGSGPIHLGHVACEDQATSLNQCGKAAISSCFHDEDIWLNCSGTHITFPPTTPSRTMTVSATTSTTADKSVTSATTYLSPVTENKAECCACEANTIAPVPLLQSSDALAIIITLSVLLGLSTIVNVIVILVILLCPPSCYRKSDSRASDDETLRSDLSSTRTGTGSVERPQDDPERTRM